MDEGSIGIAVNNTVGLALVVIAGVGFVIALVMLGLRLFVKPSKEQTANQQHQMVFYPLVETSTVWCCDQEFNMEYIVKAEQFTEEITLRPRTMSLLRRMPIIARWSIMDEPQVKINPEFYQLGEGECN